MTNQAEPFAPAPALFYWQLHLDTAAQRAKARDRGETRAVDEFIAKVNKAADLLARKNPDPAVRREAYRNKPAADWAEQFLYMMEDCAEDWADWEKVGPQDDNLRQEIIRQIEELLARAGIDLRYDDLMKASSQMERYLAEGPVIGGAAGPATSAPSATPALAAPKGSTYAPGAPLQP